MSQSTRLRRDMREAAERGADQAELDRIHARYVRQHELHPPTDAPTVAKFQMAFRQLLAKLKPKKTTSRRLTRSSHATRGG